MIRGLWLPVQRLMSLAVLGIALITSSCSEPTRTSFLLDPAQRLHSLEVNYPAVNLALVAPYDTVTLDVITRNSLGQPLPDTVAIAFTTDLSQKQIVVAPNGVVRALAQTSATGVLVTISATYFGVTRTAQARIVVTKVASPPIMDSFSLGRSFSDTFEVSPQVGLGKPAASVTPIARTSAGVVIPRLVYAFQSSNALGVSVGNGSLWSTGTGGMTLEGRRAGEPAIIRAKARVYGITMQDSIVAMTRQLSDFTSIILTDTTTTVAPEIELYRGGDVYWINTSPRNELGITFDDPDNAKPPSLETFAAMLLMWGGGTPDSGNIAPFVRDTVASPGDGVPWTTLHHSLARGRSFPVPGRYRWRTTGRLSFEGTIVVR